MVPRTDDRPSTIRLQWQDSKYEEGRAAPDTTIYPGMALEPTADEENVAQFPPGVQPNSSAGVDAVLRIAVECLLGGVGNVKEGRTVADPYLGGITANGEAFLDGEIVPYIVPKKGDYFMARVATDASFAVGDLLKLHTDGTFIAHGGSGKAVAEAMETHDFGADDPAITPLIRVQAT
jgi:hypothetical protein